MNILQRLGTKSNKFIPVLAVVLFSLASPQEVAAQIVYATDCNSGFKNVFKANEPVCASGQAQGNFLGSPGLVCVLPSSGGGPGDDVTPGKCNAVAAAGAFIDITLWFPPTDPGNYIVALFDNDGGSAGDPILINPSGEPPTISQATIDDIKSKAANNAAVWKDTEDFGKYIDDFHSAISLMWSLGTGSGVGVATFIVGELTGQPTDYNGWVLKQGGQIIAALAGQQRAKYASLAADPPDPSFTELVALDLGAINLDLASLAPLMPGVPLQYPFANQTQDSLHLTNIRLANSMAEEAALVFALMRTLEKYQGAEDDGNDEFKLLQARALKKYADQFSTQLTTTRQGALDYKTELTADGLGGMTYDGADIVALTERLTTTGLTAAEEQSLRDVGFTDATLQVLLDRANTFAAPSGSYSLGGGLDDIVSSIDAMLPVLQALADKAQVVVDYYTPLVTVQHPSADAGGPYNGSEGALVNFDASNSSDPQAQVMTAEWDFDLDGQFDDAAGAMVSNTYNAPIATQVGLRVTDTDGNVDIAYAAVSIAEVNFPPQITSFIPVDLAPTASNQNPLDFSATATDPDLDAVNFEWRVDGDVVSTASGFTYTPAIGETGTRTVRLTVSDLNPLSEDAFETRLVHLEQERIFADGFE